MKKCTLLAVAMLIACSYDASKLAGPAATGGAGAIGTGGTTGAGGRGGQSVTSSPRLDAGDIPDAPMATGGAAGIGGAMGGDGGTGGLADTGGVTGSGGASGTGGNTAPLCSPTCVPEVAICCDGNSEACVGTRIPMGDGTTGDQYAVTADGLTVVDKITGLIWQRDGLGLRGGCSGDGNLTCNWAEAQAYCAGLSLGGLSGWRLPAVMELRTIVDYTRVSPAIDQRAFPSTPSEWYWTSSPSAGSSGYAWYVYFDSGYSLCNGVGNYYRVRCVR
jgi:hypothetical protein